MMANDVALAFPEGFLWGTATASHQVEGGNENNDWWAWEQRPGRIQDGSHSGLACDWWRRAEEDLKTAADLGQNSHRMSLEWSRLEPSPGAWNEAAAERYRQILGYMRSIGLKPLVTLYHFTLPLWLYERGGWENARTVPLYVHYVERAIDAFGELCDFWCTLNEPALYVLYSYVFGVWPPGFGGPGAARQALRYLAQAHCQAYEAIHRRQPQAQVGYAKHIRLFDPGDPRRWRDRALATVLDYLFNGSVLTAFGDGILPLPWGWDLRATGKSRFLDFLGINYYSRDLVTLDLHRPQDLYIRRFGSPGVEYNAGWGEVYPEGLYRALKQVAQGDLPIYVTEFGVPDNTDASRPRFLVTHVAAMQRALREGVPLKGAYFWSLVDNWEWAAGWTARFGLIGLDPTTQARTLKRSAQVYQRIAQANGVGRMLLDKLAPELGL